MRQMQYSFFNNKSKHGKKQKKNKTELLYINKNCSKFTKMMSVHIQYVCPLAKYIMNYWKRFEQNSE